jgi:hypothetical protein
MATEPKPSEEVKVDLFEDDDEFEEFEINEGNSNSFHSFQSLFAINFLFFRFRFTIQFLVFLRLHHNVEFNYPIFMGFC